MTQTLEQFALACRRMLKEKPGPAGREQVRALLENVLKDEAFIAAYVNDRTAGREVLYEDPELGFCILAHNNRDARTSPPHDHGPSWAIYGQAQGETEMSDWELVTPASPGQPGKVRRKRSYKLVPGVAHLYNEGDLHSPSRSAPTRLIRIEGVNMEKVKRPKYEPV